MKGYEIKYLHIDVFVLIGTPKKAEESTQFKKELDYQKNLFLYKKNMHRVFHNYKSLNWKETSVQNIMKVRQVFNSSKSIIKKFESLCERYKDEESGIIVNNFRGYRLKEFTPKSFYGREYVKTMKI